MSPPVVNRKRARAAPALRADAAANRATLIQTAAQMFAKGGIDVSVEAIARRAGVGIGTLYRHFPTKNALIAAIVATRIDAMAAEAEAFAEARAPGAAFERVVERLVVEGAAKKDFIAALGGIAELGGPVMDAAKKRFKAAMTTLVERAQAVGSLRKDISAADVMSLVRGVNTAAGDDAKARALHLRILLDGLRVV